jgi:hypothetical protein
MRPKTHLTTKEIAEALGIPVWLARRAVDALGEDIPRAGLYRLVPRELLPRVKAALTKAGRASAQTQAAGQGPSNG